MGNYKILFSKKPEDIPAIYSYLMAKRHNYIHQAELAASLAVIAAGVCFIFSNTYHPTFVLLAAAPIVLGFTFMSDATLTVASKLAEAKGVAQDREARYEYLDRLINHTRPRYGFSPLYGIFAYVVYLIIPISIAASIIWPNM